MNPNVSRRGPMLPGEGDKSIKARKQQLFDSDELQDASATGSGKPFAEYLRETHAAPMPLWIKATLVAAGLVVAALLVAALLRLNQPKKPKVQTTMQATARALDS